VHRHLTGAAAPTAADAPDAAAIVAKAAEIIATEPGNRCAKYLTKEIVDQIPQDQLANFYACVKTGLDNPDSGLGCYAMTPQDYTTFKPFFEKVIGDYHKDDPNTDAVHVTDWDASGVGEGGVLDVTKLGVSELSMRVRVGRNLKEFNLPGAMDRAERIRFEQRMQSAFEALKVWGGGEVYSLTPDFGKDADGNAVPNPNLIDDAKYKELVDAHVMFKDMDNDVYLKSAGISSDWPYGRGCWQSADKECIVWFGEEDQLRIMSMKTGTRLDEVFTRLRTLLDTIEAIEGIEFAVDERYGYVTSCPSNLGTGMRASVHIKVPNLTSDGTDAKAKEVCGPLGLSVRGTGGEHTPIGADGTIDISPRNRLFIKENEIVAKLYNAIQLVAAAEAEAGGAA